MEAAEIEAGGAGGAADSAMPAATSEAEEAYVEVEKDAEKSPAPHGSVVTFSAVRSSLNCLQLGDGLLLKVNSKGAKATVGVKSGRYMFEVRVVEVLNPKEDIVAAGCQPHSALQQRWQ
eukprot:5692243-Amphidinium_carterae.1